MNLAECCTLFGNSIWSFSFHQCAYRTKMLAWAWFHGVCPPVAASKNRSQTRSRAFRKGKADEIRWAALLAPHDVHEGYAFLAGWYRRNSIIMGRLVHLSHFVFEEPAGVWTDGVGWNFIARKNASGPFNKDNWCGNLHYKLKDTVLTFL